MSHIIMIWEKIIEMRIRIETSISENEFDIMPGKSTMETLFLDQTTSREVQGKRIKTAFINLEYVALKNSTYKVTKF